MKWFKCKRFLKGIIYRGLIIRSKINYNRINNVFIKFNENVIVLVNLRLVFILNRVYGLVLIELCRKLLLLGCVIRYMI